MYKKLTITVEEDLYKAIHKIIGRGKISGFLSQLARPYVLKKDAKKAYQEMVADKEREEEAHVWSEANIQDIANEKR
jgi:hypothetical protein